MSEGVEWMMIGLDEKMAKRQGVPPQVPVPKAEFESLAEKGLQMDQLKKWISAFMQAAPSSWRQQNNALASRYDAFVGKVDMWNRAQQAFQKNDMKSAIATLKMISNVDPNDHASKMNLGSALASSGDFPGAMKLFEAVRPTFEGEADYHVAVGHVHMALQNRDGAVGEMVLALEAKPDHREALAALKNLGVLIAIYEDPRDAASLTYVRADSVVPYLEGVWDQKPRDAAYYLEQLVYHENERRWPLVVAAAERALAAGKGTTDAKLKVGLERAVLSRAAALRELGKKDEALASVDEYLAGEPKSATALVERARCLDALGKGDQVRAEIDRALEIDPGNLMALDLRFWPVERGDIAIIQQAVGPLTDFANAHASVPGVWRSLARCKLAVGSIDEGLALFEKAVGLAPDDDDLRSEWWSELAKQTKFDKILEDAGKISDMKTRDWKLRWSEAEAFQGVGRKMEAHTAFGAINHDESLHIDIRKRAKRAAEQAQQAEAK
jgi:tetratricopeptide (TPR) repeat protein